MSDDNAAEIYGRLLEGAYFAGHSFERACSNLEWLLQEGRWRSVGKGFDDVNRFLDSVRLDTLRVSAEQRKRIGQLIKRLQPEASNRAIAKVVGADHVTINRDLAGESSPHRRENENQNKDDLVAGGEHSPPPISGVAAARLVERRTHAKEQRLARVQADEQRVLRLRPIAGKFKTIILDPAWDYDWLSIAGRAKPGYAMQTHEELLALDVRAWADDAGCHLYLWVTNNFMARGCELMAHWGFQHRTVLTWIKPPPFGLGSYFRNSTEHVLFGTLGDTTTRQAAASISTHFEAPRRDHSEKPERFYEIVRAASYPPYGEGNQRDPRDGFSNLFEATAEAAE